MSQKRKAGNDETPTLTNFERATEITPNIEAPNKSCTGSGLTSHNKRLKLCYDLPTLEEHDVSELKQVAADIYQPLKAWQTRTIEIEPGNLGDDVITHLRAADLVHKEGIVFQPAQSCVSYLALSYHWGFPTRTRSIRCNSKLFPVSDAIYRALQRLRRPCERLYLWIDALCINQFDLVEKSVQVQKMLLIFQKAQKVVAWLGDQDCPGYWAARYIRDHDNRAMAKPTCMGPLDRELRHELLKLCSNEWTRRTWVRQEVYAARELSVQCGDVRLDWQVLIDWAAGSGIGTIPIAFQILKTSRMQHIKRLTKEYHERGNFVQESPVAKLYALLRTSGVFHATDPRDFVYGIIGMVDIPTLPGRVDTGQDIPSLAIDYDKSVDEVFQGVTELLLRNYLRIDTLVILAYMSRRHTPSDSILAAAPSWVPDWSAVNANAARAVDMLIHSFYTYSAPPRLFEFFTPETLKVEKNIPSFTVQHGISLSLFGNMLGHVGNPQKPGLHPRGTGPWYTIDFERSLVHHKRLADSVDGWIMPHHVEAGDKIVVPFLGLVLVVSRSIGYGVTSSGRKRPIHKLIGPVDDCFVLGPKNDYSTCLELFAPTSTGLPCIPLEVFAIM